MKRFRQALEEEKQESKKAKQRAEVAEQESKVAKQRAEAAEQQAKEKALEIARKMLADGLDVAIVMKYTCLSPDELAAS